MSTSSDLLDTLRIKTSMRSEPFHGRASGNPTARLQPLETRPDRAHNTG